MNTIPPNPTISIVDPSGKMDQHFRVWTQIISELSIIEGSGSPNGIVEALPTKLYMDSTGAPGAILYIKQVADVGGDRRLGWVLV